MLADDAPAMDAPAFLAAGLSNAAPAFRPQLTLGAQPGAAVLLLEITSRAEGAPTPEPPPVPPTPTIVTSGLVMHLDAGDAASYPGTGTAWTDLSGNGNNGILINGPTYSAANGGQIVFDGVNDFISTELTQPPVTQYTVELWFKSTSSVITGDNVFLFHCRGNPQLGFSGVSLTWLPNRTAPGELEFGVSSNNVAVFARAPGTVFNDGSWRQVVGVFSQPLGQPISWNSFEIYVNGEKTIKTQGFTAGGATSPVAGLGGTEIGRINTGYWAGNVAIARVYNRALSASEITQNFNANKARFGL
jgi:hypothetical protein